MRYLFGFMCVLAFGVMGCEEEIIECGAGCLDGGLAVETDPWVISRYDVELDLDGVAGAFTCDRSDLGAWFPTNQTGSGEAVSKCDPGGFTVAETPDAVEISIDAKADTWTWTGSAKANPTYTTTSGPPCTWPCPPRAVVTVQGAVACVDDVCTCSEAGIHAAIAEGGGPFTFDCDGPTTVMTEAEIEIDNDVILNGEGNLTVDGSERHRVFSVHEATVELKGLSVTSGFLDASSCSIDNRPECWGAGILNQGTLVLRDSTLSGNVVQAGFGGGVASLNAELTVLNSTVSGNTGGGIYIQSGYENPKQNTIANSTVSGNTSGLGHDIDVTGELTLVNSTVSGIIDLGTKADSAHLAASVIGRCQGPGFATSLGYNIESPGNTCGFDEAKGDQFNVTEEQLNLGELADNGGPTMTRALLPGSLAIDVIPADMCEVDEDQRGEPRPETGGTMCDVGAFEVQP